LSTYREVERLAALGKLVSAASQLTIKALNAESAATQSFVSFGSLQLRAEVDAARKVLEAIRAFKDGAASADLPDPKALGIINDIERRLGGRDAYRQNADARTLERSASGELLAPITNGLADLFQRLAALIDQEQLSQLLLVLHAVMKVSDGQKFEANRTGIALTDGPLDAATYQALLRAVAQQSIVIKVFDDFGPARAREQLAAFEPLDGLQSVWLASGPARGGVRRSGGAGRATPGGRGHGRCRSVCRAAGTD
jgi:hypothetical protein